MLLRTFSTTVTDNRNFVESRSPVPFIILLPESESLGANHSHFNSSRNRVPRWPIWKKISRIVFGDFFPSARSPRFCGIRSIVLKISCLLITVDRFAFDKIYHARTKHIGDTHASPSLFGRSCAGESATPKLVRPSYTRVRPSRPRDAALDPSAGVPWRVKLKIFLEHILLPSGKETRV